MSNVAFAELVKELPPLPPNSDAAESSAWGGSNPYTLSYFEAGCTIVKPATDKADGEKENAETTPYIDQSFMLKRPPGNICIKINEEDFSP